MSQTPTLREGSCRCGAVRFRVTGAPLVTMACHCTGCQKMTGGAYSLSALYPAAAFEMVAGDTVPGGLKQAHDHRFCADCLSWLFTRAAGMEDFVNVRTPMLEDAASLPPYVETWTAERLPGAATGAVHGFEGFPPPDRFPELMEGYARWHG